MRNKLWYLTGVSLKRKMKTKWFVLANALLALLIVGVINIDSIITFFGGDFNQKQEVYVIDDTKEATELFQTQLDALSISFNGDDEESSYKVTAYDKTMEEAKKEVEKNKKIIVVHFESDPNTYLKVTLLSEGYMDSIDYQVMSTAINNTKTGLALAHSNIPEEELNKIYAPLEIERLYLDDTKKSEEESMETIMTTIFPIFILPFFMLALFLIQMIGAEVNDEKTTRGMEIIISNVSPKTHFFAKVIAGNVFVISQAVLLVVYAGLGMGIRLLLGGSSLMNGLGGEVGKVFDGIMSSGLAQTWMYLVPLTLVLMLLTFLAYSLVAGVLASITTNTEDFQQLQTPIIMVSLIGYFLAVMAGMFKGALFIRIFSYIPFISAILSPSLLALGQIGIVDIVISLVIMVVVNYLLIRYGLKVYKVGILNYSSEGLWKKMWKAMKE